MRDAMSILIRPVVSEKTYAQMEQGTYTFVVDRHATKVDVRNAVQQAFNVTVTKVNTLNRKGKATRNRRTGIVGTTPATKRAIVTLRAGDTINLFES
jgi:large subunit ribosomal protein L23